jgi:hypothetical protein
MAEQKIEFRKIRDFGEIMNDTFSFIRQNFKPLFRSFFAICSFFMIAMAILTGLYQSQYLQGLDELMYGKQMQGGLLRQVANSGYFIMVFFGLATFIAMQVAIGAYVKYYVTNNSARAGIEEVWSIFIRYFPRVFLYCVPFTLFTILGCFFCLFPGVYLWTVFLPFPMIVIMENRGFTETYSRCFDLITYEFWPSFGVYIVGYLIYLISTTIIEGLFTFIFQLFSVFSTGNMTQAKDFVIAFLDIFSYSFYIVFYLAVILQYFNLVEKKEGTGLLHRINTIGGNRNHFDNIEEQY